MTFLMELLTIRVFECYNSLMEKHNFSNKFRFDVTKPIALQHCTLYQVGDLLCTDDTFIDDHIQKNFELSFIDFGTAVFYTNDIPLPVKAGDIYINFKGDKHRIVPSKKDLLRYFYISFSFDSPLNEIIHELSRRHKSETNRIINARHLFPYIQTILSEMNEGKEYCLEIIESTIVQLLVMLQRADDGDIFRSVMYKTYSQKGLVQNIVNYIDSNITEVSHVSVISSKFNYTRTYLSMLFKSVTGMTLQSYIAAKKFEKACTLLTSEKKSVTETAEILNFSSVNNFSRAFKNYYKMSPQQYQYKKLENNAVSEDMPRQ